MNKKLVLIDGHSILNRAFYGLPDLTNAQGIHTNAVYGFLNILFKILDEEQPEYLAVAFDVHAPTFRHKMYEAYKGTRKPMAEELRQQVPLIKEMLAAMGIFLMEREGYEADDLLGTAARQAEEAGFSVSVVSGDRDLLQLASDRVKIRIPKTKRTGTEIEDYYGTDVLARYQVTPEQFVDVKALMGDASDNIPGVPGIGEKTAVGLIAVYGSIENAYEHIEEIKPNRARESLSANYDLAVLSKKLAAIDRNAPAGFVLEEAKLHSLYTKEAYLLCKRLELKQILNRFPEDAPKGSGERKWRAISDFAQAQAFLSAAGASSLIGIAPIAQDGEFLGAAICFGETEAAFLAAGGFLTEQYLLERIRELLLDGPDVSFLDLKEEIKRFSLPTADKKLRGRLFGCAIASYLLNPLQGSFSGEDIAKNTLDLLLPSWTELFGKMGHKAGMEEKPDAFASYICSMAYAAWKARDILREQLRQAEMLSLYEQIELPLAFVLADMEREGIAADKEALSAYGKSLDGRISSLTQGIYEKAGEEFNINSPKQLGTILFEKLGLAYGKKTKTGYSTAADVLERLAGEYPLVAEILEYRQLAKLKSTYADGLLPCIDETGRIHSTFHQTITATGRISSADPNLQNIPVRMELGRMIRKVFCAREGHVFVDADYSQIELRVLAHLSGDEKLIAAYRQDEDIHKITASEVFHVPFGEVTAQQRRNAKAVNFGIVYGISSFGLSQDLSISKQEAAEYIARYFETYPKIKQFLDGLIADAKKKGYSLTMFGRRRPVPELASGNFVQHSFGERVAMNAPIQGTAADIIKIAMVRVHDRLAREGLQSKLILQVHDELLIEAEHSEEERVKQILSEEMKGAAQMAVALEIDLHTGSNWYEAK